MVDEVQILDEAVKAPEKLTAEQLDSLANLVDQYPYFQTGHILYAKCLKNAGDARFEQQLSLTAIHTNNRDLLYDLISIPAPVEDVKMQEEKVVVKEDPLPVADPTPETVDQVQEEPTHEPIEVDYKAEEDLATLEQNYQAAAMANEFLSTEELEDPVEDIRITVEEQAAPTPDKLSFNDWLKEYEDYPAEQNPTEVVETQPEQSPSVEGASSFYSPSKMAKQSIEESEEIVTETLAKIYVAQNHIDKAIWAYEVLALRFPSKSAYFATQIKTLKDRK